MYRALEQATEGGAPQPAESTADARRIASDGQAYTSEHYAEAYGDDAQRCWDDVKGDRSPPPRSPSPELEENRSPLPRTPSSESVTHNEPSSSSTCPQFPPGDFEVTTRQSTFRKLRQNEEYSNPEKFKLVYWTETNKVMREMCESLFGRDTSPERLLPLKRIVPVEKVQAEPELFEASHDMPADYVLRTALPFKARYPHESATEVYRRQRLNNKTDMFRRLYLERCARKPPPQ